MGDGCNLVVFGLCWPGEGLGVLTRPRAPCHCLIYDGFSPSPKVSIPIVLIQFCSFFTPLPSENPCSIPHPPQPLISSFSSAFILDNWRKTTALCNLDSALQGQKASLSLSASSELGRLGVFLVLNYPSHTEEFCLTAFRLPDNYQKHNIASIQGALNQQAIEIPCKALITSPLL